MLAKTIIGKGFKEVHLMYTQGLYKIVLYLVTYNEYFS